MSDRLVMMQHLCNENSLSIYDVGDKNKICDLHEFPQTYFVSKALGVQGAPSDIFVDGVVRRLMMYRVRIPDFSENETPTKSVLAKKTTQVLNIFLFESNELERKYDFERPKIGTGGYILLYI